MSGIGTCVCGDIRVSYTGEPAGNALCHCIDCQKIGGATYSTNFLIPEDNFKLEQGTPQQWKKTADSGNDIVSFICSKCGTTVWRETPGLAGLKITKTGIYNGDELKETPKMELFAHRRVPWVQPIPGAKQVNGMS